MWELPEDYYKRLSRVIVRREDSKIFEGFVHLAVDTISWVGRPFRFGNFSVCRISK
jgi:hypothetical protein